VTQGIPLRARFRVVPEDFEVEEILGFEPDGEGEHLWLWVEKRGANTPWVAGALARWAGVPGSAVSYAGMKDRHAVTRQWFNLHLPRRIAPDDDPAIEGVRVLRRSWHGRKLRRGAHRGNRFVIVLRDVEGDLAEAERRLAGIAAQGVPNAFGDQRFGRDRGNLDAARQWLADERPRRLPHDRRGLLLSAARSHLFNLVLDERFRRGDWFRGVAGDCFQLDGSGSWFGPEAKVTAELAERLGRGDIHPTGPLWGAGEPPTSLEARAIEDAVAAAEPGLCSGLARFDLRQERRALRVLPRAFAWFWLDEKSAAAGTPSNDEGTGLAASDPGGIPAWPNASAAAPARDAAPSALRLSFELPRGSFATAVIAAFCQAADASRGA
jgi:tRNA pseudouridine13 synthase